MYPLTSGLGYCETPDMTRQNDHGERVSASYPLMKAKRSGLITSALTVSIPCGYPG
jgi:hypothetical protein